MQFSSTRRITEFWESGHLKKPSGTTFLSREKNFPTIRNAENIAGYEKTITFALLYLKNINAFENYKRSLKVFGEKTFISNIRSLEYITIKYNRLKSAKAAKDKAAKKGTIAGFAGKKIQL